MNFLLPCLNHNVCTLTPKNLSKKMVLNVSFFIQWCMYNGYTLTSLSVLHIHSVPIFFFCKLFLFLRPFNKLLFCSVSTSRFDKQNAQLLWHILLEICHDFANNLLYSVQGYCEYCPDTQYLDNNLPQKISGVDVRQMGSGLKLRSNIQSQLVQNDIQGAILLDLKVMQRIKKTYLHTS